MSAILDLIVIDFPFWRVALALRVTYGHKMKAKGGDIEFGMTAIYLLDIVMM